MPDNPLIRNCPICSSEISHVIDNVTSNERTVDVVKCSKCGFIYMLDIFFENTHTHGLSQIYVDNPLPRRRHYAILDCLSKRGGITNVAEIGAGHGQLASLLLENGYSYLGYEPNIERANFCSSKGIKIINNLFSVSPNTFDCVILDNVLEHVPSPIQLMNEIYESLKKDGIVLIVVPNANDLRKFSSKWKNKHLYIRAHINYFTSSSLRKLAFKTGFSFEVFKVRFQPICNILFNLIKICWKFQFFPTGLYVTFQKK